MRKGFREPLLCYKKCEPLSQVYDDYAIRVWQGTEQKAQYESTPDGLLVKNLDYSKMKLFFILTLWRAGISNLPDFAEIQLGPHEQRMRQMILEGNPGHQYEYPCILLSSRKDPQVRNIMQHFMAILGKVKAEGHTVYRFFIGSFFWLLFSSVKLKATRYDTFSSIKENGELFIYQNDKYVESVLLQTAKVMNSSLRLNQDGKPA